MPGVSIGKMVIISALSTSFGFFHVGALQQMVEQQKFQTFIN